ncbi:MAG: crossover junction endodeoxyribonuclease RuvC [Actinomycetota bacterium]
MFVLGIDPGLSRCGYGCLEQARAPRAIAAGVIRTDPKQEQHLRLAEMQQEIRALIREFEPQVVAIERVLFQHNVSTAMSVGMAVGVVMAEAATAGCDVVEYSPNEVKESVAGWGGADKDEVGTMVQTLLGLPKRLAPADAADAVAVALCHLARVPARRARASAAAHTRPDARAASRGDTR